MRVQDSWSEGVPGSELSVLIVDDEEVDRQRLHSFCQKAGLRFDVSEAANIAQLRERLDEKAFDFVFLDYHLGMETGLEALHVLTSHEEQDNAVPIMVTSVGQSNIIIEAMRSGCADYLIKDEISVESLRKSVSSALERRILLAALSRERAVRRIAAATVDRISRSCAPDMRRILSTMTRRLRTIQSANPSCVVLRGEVLVLSGSCGELFGFLDELCAMFDAEPNSIEEKSAVILQLGK
jgi:DNA-binding NtrC family response regulator